MSKTFGRRSARVAFGAGAAVMMCAAFVPATVSAAPGNPGVPSAPTTIFAEGFGTGAAPGQLALLENYGAANYTADAPWRSAAAGNGLVIDGTTTDATLTAAGYPDLAGTGDAKLRALATKLGQLNGSSPANLNHAVTAYTDNDPGANLIEFRTKTPINLSANGRFLTIAANVAAVNCKIASSPLLDFFLDDNGTQTKVNNAPLDPCPSPGSAGDTDDPVAETLQGGRAVLFTGNAVGIVLRNQNGSGAGNDHAYDDIRVLDVTPQLDKKFAEEGKNVDEGDASDLIFTVTNTSELGAKTGWSFTDKLPSGLTVAGPASSTCVAGTVVANKDAGTISITGGSLADGEKSCTIKVPVKTNKAGKFTNSAANITSAGLNAPGATTILFKDNGDDDDDSDDNDLAAPDTGAQPSPMWPWTLALGSGLVLIVAAGTRTAISVKRKR